MSAETFHRVPSTPEETIRLLQDELAETNREVLLLTVDLDERVEERTAELRAAQEELRQTNADLVQRTAQLETANQELESFSYSVSHDLRAPARRIGGFVGIILTDYGSTLTREVREWIDKISKEAAEMSQLIQDLLAFARMGRSAMRPSHLSMDDLLKGVLQELSADTQGRNIEWNIGALPLVLGDPALLKQVWVNLLSNATKYTRARAPARIKIGCLQKENEWEFYVNDNGAGFDMLQAEKLFGVFQRLHSSEEFEGTGIGLATVQRIIERHGGRTWAEGRINEGATVYFTLPYNLSPPAQDVATPGTGSE